MFKYTIILYASILSIFLTCSYAQDLTCLDCLNFGTDGSSTPCSSGMVCTTTDTGFPFCSTISASNGKCHCPTRASVDIICDPYSATTYDICNNGIISSVGKCKEGLICYDGTCIEGFTTVSPPSCNGSLYYTQTNCTNYYSCAPDAEKPVKETCDNGQVFSYDVFPSACKPYSTDPCPGDKSFVEDSNNCAFYYICSQKNRIAVNLCPENYTYNEKGGCEPGLCYNDCTPCTTTLDAFKIDNTWYYQCVATKEDNEDNYGFAVTPVQCRTGYHVEEGDTPADLTCAPDPILSDQEVKPDSLNLIKLWF